MELTLQYFDGCPNWETTDRDLQRAIDELSIETAINYQRIDTPGAAAKYGFRGSPTLLIDGVDPFAGPDATIGLACRIYQTAEGPTGTPSVTQLKQALKAAHHAGT